MVDRQIAHRGVRAPLVLDAMRNVPREAFLPPELREFAFTNYGVAIGLQAVGAMPERVDRLHSYFDGYRSGDEYDREAITHVMACSSHLPGYLLRGYA